MPSTSGPNISVVFPVYDEEDNLPQLYDQVKAALGQAQVSHELVFVDNGSRDRSLALIKGFAEQDQAVRYISLSRNFGHQGGLFAGMNYAKGQAIVTMDADLQHPPSLLPEMIRLWQEGYDVVYTIKRNYHFSGWKLKQVQLFYWLTSKISGLKLSFGQSDFRLLDRKVLDVVLQIPEYRKFLRGTVDWIGFRQTGLEYEIGERQGGQSKFSYLSLVSFAGDGILAFSILPLRWILLTGLFLAGLSILYGLFALIVGLVHLLGFWETVPSGWATLAVAVTFLGSAQLIAVGVLGEYVGRIYEQTKGRPVFIVREMSDHQQP